MCLSEYIELSITGPLVLLSLGNYYRFTLEGIHIGFSTGISSISLTFDKSKRFKNNGGILS